MTADKPSKALTIAQMAKLPICPNCGGEVVRKSPKGPPKTFCGSACQKEFQNRAAVEGRAIIALAKAWRCNRGSGDVSKEAMKQLCSALDLFNADDRQAGRPKADLFGAKLMADGRLPIDRLKR